MSVTTMEEVFLKVKDESDEDIESRLKRKGSLRPSSDRPPVEPAEHSPPPTGLPYSTPHLLQQSRVCPLVCKHVQ